jgi:hypothetical protein
MKKIIRMLEILRKLAIYAVLIFSGMMALVIWSIGSSGESLSNNQYGLIITILVLWGIIGIDEVFLNRIDKIRKERDETKKEAAEREKIIMQFSKKKIEEVCAIDNEKNKRIEMLKKKAKALEERLSPEIIKEVEETLAEEMLNEKISSAKKKKPTKPSSEKLILRDYFAR